MPQLLGHFSFLRIRKLAEKQWVFGELVKHEQDAEGLIAYALYKNQKHQLATRLRKDGTDEITIQEKVTAFHDNILKSGQLDTYRERATVFLHKLLEESEKTHKTQIENLTTRLNKNKDDEISKLTATHKKDLAKEKKELLKKMQAYNLESTSIGSKFVSFLLSGIPSFVSGAIITTIFYGFLVWSIPQDSRKQFINDRVSSVLGGEQSDAASSKSKIGTDGQVSSNR